MSLGNEDHNSFDSQTSIIGALKHFENSVDMMRMSAVSPSYCEQVLSQSKSKSEVWVQSPIQKALDWCPIELKFSQLTLRPWQIY